MAQNTTVISIPQMVDLALNSPEVGVVNFTILHSLLHVIVSQLHLTETNVEFRGSDSERLQSYIQTAKPGPLLTLTEYSIEGESKGDEKGQKDEEQKEKDQDTVIVVGTSKANIHGPQFSVAISKQAFENMGKSIQELQETVKELSDLPTNAGLIDAIRAETEGGKTPVLDMFQILSLSKRLDAAEVTTEKLASMVEDIARGSTHGRRSSAKGGADPELEKRIMDLEKAVSEGIGLGGGGPRVSKSRKRSIDSEFPREEMATLVKDVADLKALLNSDSDAKPPEVRISQLETKFNECLEQLASLDTMFSRQLGGFQKQIAEMERDIGNLLEKMNLGPSTDGGQGGGQMFSRLAELQEELNGILEATQTLMDEREERQHAIDVMTEQIELLKTVKADREDLEDALAEKADACAVNKKVSIEQFDAVCEDMNRSIEDALTKLNQQEEMWNQALEDIQREVGNKLDRMELNPLRDFINSKLKNLQEKVKALTALKKENEAAGTKSKYLRNVNCISCDKDVVMRKEVDSSLFPKPYAVPPTRSMGPYLAYELDQLRKQQKCAPASKNLSMFENAMQSGKTPKGTDHICNRYCGGSHTVTTPQQRVTRLGHFLEQWGPELAPVQDTSVRGTDGHLYKGRDDKFLRELAAEKPPTTHIESRSPIHISGDLMGEKETCAPSDPTSPTGAPPAEKGKSAETDTVQKGSEPTSPKGPPAGEQSSLSGVPGSSSKAKPSPSPSQSLSESAQKSDRASASAVRTSHTDSMKKDGGSKAPSLRASKGSVTKTGSAEVAPAEPPAEEAAPPAENAPPPE